jgi:hypothetical protein
MKGLYFFPGERQRKPDNDTDPYTTHPLDPRDEHWNSVKSTRAWVVDRMVRAHANVVVMSYWSDMPQWSPMNVASDVKRNVVCRKHPELTFQLESGETVPGVLDAVQGRPLLIVPAIEEGNDPDCPELPHFVFSAEFPFRRLTPAESPQCGPLRNNVDRSAALVAQLESDVHGATGTALHGFALRLKDAQQHLANDRAAVDRCARSVAPGLISRIGLLVDFFRGRMNLWGQMYDRNGDPRYAVNILHVRSNVIAQRLHDDGDDREFAAGFDIVAARVKSLYHIDVGFTIDTIDGGGSYSALPGEAGAALERTPSVLAIQGFASEIFSGVIDNGDSTPCVLKPDKRCVPHDNNVANLERLADWKRAALEDWLRTQVPVVLDVTNGYDARVVFGRSPQGPPPRTAFWGDNLDYTEDRWRNWMSELKGPGIKGIVFDTWNGYTEGYAAVASVEHGQTVLNWLTDLLEPPPWDCSHMHYVNGAPTHRVYGGICEKWLQLGADRAFGAPVSDELPNGTGRAQYFVDSKAIYWSGNTGAHSAVGLIGKAYREAGAGISCLGFPVSDEEVSGNDRILRFERGTISWTQGDSLARIACR